jgi:periplasmic protein TonB
VDVTDVLRGRMQAAPTGLQRMVWLSLAAHAVLLTGVLLLPAQYVQGHREDLSQAMHISLGGSAGPSSGGMSAIGGRPVQTTEPAPRPEPVRPPAVEVPKMTVPTEGPQRKARQPTPEDQPTPREARGTTPTRGEKVTSGSSVAETGARGQGFGLTTGGGGAGSGVTLDVGNFCCPEYIATMVARIRSNWQSNASRRVNAVVKFTIARDGTISGVRVSQSSGDFTLDQAAQRAVASVRALPPLPAEFTNPTLTVDLTFEYHP